MTELVVAEIERRSRGSLVETVGRKGALEKRPLIFGNGCPEVAGRSGLGDRSRLGGRNRFSIVLHRRGMLRLERGWRPGRMEGIELDRIDLPLRVFPAIDGALDHVPQLTYVAGPVVGLELGHCPG